MQLFPRSLNYLPLALAVGAAGAGGGVTFLIWYYFSPKNLQVGYAPEQPIPYSHKLHADELGIDCRYCHANVERSQEAMVPPTQTCMGCHAVVKTDSRRARARCATAGRAASRSSGCASTSCRTTPTSITACTSPPASAASSCHGRIDQMEVVRLDKPLAMGWCLECHRDPAPNLRPKDRDHQHDLEADDEAQAQRARRTPTSIRRSTARGVTDEQRTDTSRYAPRTASPGRSSGAASKQKADPERAARARRAAPTSSKQLDRRSSELTARLRAPQLPDAERRDLGARRARGLHPPSGREDPAVHARRRRTCRRACRCTTRRVLNRARRGARPARPEPRGPPDQDRRQPGPPDQPRRDRPARAGVDPRPLRPRSRAHADRSRRRGRRRYADFDAALDGAARGARAATAAQGCASCASRRNSPTLPAPARRGQASACPHARFHTYAPVNDGNARAGTRARVRPAAAWSTTTWRRPRSILSLDSDFLGTERRQRAARRVSSPRAATSTSAEAREHEPAVRGRAEPDA